MMDCDDIQTMLFLGATLVPDAEAHIAACARCAADRGTVRALVGVLSAETLPAPPAALSARAVRAAAPLLAGHARRVTQVALTRALGAVVLALPVLVFVNIVAGRAVFDLLRTMLPETLSLYVVLDWGATLSLLFALTCGAIPILAERQARLAYRESHG